MHKLEKVHKILLASFDEDIQEAITEAGGFNSLSTPSLQQLMLIQDWREHKRGDVNGPLRRFTT